MSNYECGFAVLDSKIYYKAIVSNLNHMTQNLEQVFKSMVQDILNQWGKEEIINKGFQNNWSHILAIKGKPLPQTKHKNVNRLKS